MLDTGCRTKVSPIPAPSQDCAPAPGKYCRFLCRPANRLKFRIGFFRTPPPLTCPLTHPPLSRFPATVDSDPAPFAGGTAGTGSRPLRCRHRDRRPLGQTTVLGKARAIYDWICTNMYRDPNTRGCDQGDVGALLITPGGTAPTSPQSSSPWPAPGSAALPLFSPPPATHCARPPAPRHAPPARQGRRRRRAPAKPSRRRSRPSAAGRARGASRQGGSPP